ncbi:MAG: hypothetical protein ACI8QZ_000807 [Chlamydiales bacterium]|jgi:hypothetical protein
MISKKILSRARAALVLLALTATIFTVVASAAPDSVRRANASRAGQQRATRGKSQAQAKQRAQAQQSQRAQAQQRQRAQAQAQARQRAQAQAAQRARTQAAQRAKAQQQERAQAQAKQRAQAQAKAKQRSASKATKRPSRPDQKSRQRDQDAQRLKQSLNSGSGSVRPGSRPATRPATAETDRMTRDRDRPHNGDHLQNGNRRPGSISGATDAALPPGSRRRDVDWDSAGDRFNQGGNEDSGRWEGIRDEHGDLDVSGGKYTSEVTGEWEVSGFKIGGGGGGGYGSGYGYYDEEEEPMDWVDDNRPYTPANNEFYAADSKEPTTIEPMIDPRTGEVIGQGTEPVPVTDTPALLPGSRITKLSSRAVLADTSGEALYFDRGMFFRDHQVGKRYEAVAPPLGAIVPRLPKGYRKVTLAGTEYSIYQNVYYKTVYKAGQVVYMVDQVGN